MSSQITKFIIIVVLSSLFMTSLGSFDSHIIISNTHGVASYEEAAPFMITHNDNFTDFGFTGLGTQENPYTLENVEIIDEYGCVQIVNTTAHFEIKDSQFLGLEGSMAPSIAMSFMNVSNAILDNCTIGYVMNGMQIMLSENITFRDCIFHDIYPTSLVVGEVSNLSILGCDFIDAGMVIDVSSSEGVLIEDSYMFDVSGTVSYSPGVTIRGCTMINGGQGFYFFQENCSVIDCTIIGNNYAIVGEMYAANLNVTNNLIVDCGYGITMYGGASGAFIYNNTLHHNDNAMIWSGNSRNCTTMNNIFYKNLYAIMIGGSTPRYGPNLFVHNIIAWNEYPVMSYAINGSDWDDGVNGNFWSRYSGTGVYVIAGSVSDVDNHPMGFNDTDGSPVIDSPTDMMFDEGTTGHILEWSPIDDWPGNYTLYINDVVEFANVRWTGGPISFNISLQVHGTHNYTISVSDGEGNIVSDSVIVIVTDVTPSILAAPSDFVMLEESTGNFVNWSALDSHPVLYRIYINDVVVLTSDWDGSNISYNIDSLTIGQYNVTLLVLDDGNLSVTDSVMVEVIDVISPVIIPLSDLTFNVGDTVWAYWVTEDRNPVHVTAYLEGEVVLDEDWFSGAVMVHLGALEVGFYNLTIEVVDAGDNYATDTIFVEVLGQETTRTTTTEPTNTTIEFVKRQDYNAFVALVLGALVILVVLVSILFVMTIVMFRNNRS
ncbi:MAG: right-handed parallel beta-helix repeat-containing protein [Candidatus Thorarchaeota archaeon]